ncbi:hypothetical protein Tco_1288916, partial [Tanacetum coccineum]
ERGELSEAIIDLLTNVSILLFTYADARPNTPAVERDEVVRFPNSFALHGADRVLPVVAGWEKAINEVETQWYKGGYCFKLKLSFCETCRWKQRTRVNQMLNRVMCGAEVFD